MLLPRFMRAECPSHVLPYQRGGIVRPGAQRSQHFRLAGSVAQTYRQVAQPALVADAPDRRAAQTLVELRLGPGEQLDQARRVEAVAHLEVRLCGNAREAVPRADQLAIVAAIDAVANQGPQLDGDGAFVLDGEVRDAASRIELVGGADRPRRTDVDAALAAPAMLGLWRIQRQRQVAVDLAEEKPRARLAAQQQGVLAAPADPGARGKLDFHHRCRIAEHAVPERAGRLRNALAQPLQPAAQHLVVIAATRVLRDVRAIVLPGQLVRWV